MNDTGRPFLFRWFKVEPGELAALAWSCAYFFCLLSGYYILRPLRDAMGAAGGIENLKWLYLGTLTAMLVASVVFAAITTRYARARFIPIVYRFFILNLLIFLLLRKTLPESSHINLGRVFFVWVSVYNLFIVSVFWSLMADIFTNAQGRRLFAFIAVGGTLGQISGSWIVGNFAERLGAVNLTILTMVLLEVACWCVRRLNAIAPGRADAAPREPAAAEPLGGSALAGFRHIVRSPYLAGICLFMFCYTLTSTFLEITKLDVGARRATGEDVRVAFFASIDFWTGVVTVLAQVFVTSRLIARFGVGITLGLLPVVTLVGFFVLGVSVLRPESVATVTALTVFLALRRATNYAVSRPAREVLYTVVSREDRFKSKNFIDTFVYRLGDQIGAWLYPALVMLGAAAVSFTAVPLAAGWFVVALLLGRKQRALAADA